MGYGNDLAEWRADELEQSNYCPAIKNAEDLPIEEGESTSEGAVCAESLESLELDICTTTENTATDVMATMNGPECDTTVEPETGWLALGGLPAGVQAIHELQEK